MGLKILHEWWWVRPSRRQEAYFRIQQQNPFLHPCCLLPYITAQYQNTSYQSTNLGWFASLRGDLNVQSPGDTVDGAVSCRVTSSVLASEDLCTRPILPCRPGGLMYPTGNQSLNFLATKGKDGYRVFPKSKFSIAMPLWGFLRTSCSFTASSLHS